MPPSAAPVQNRLLAALPARDRQHLLAGCQAVELSFADVLCQPGVRMRHVYFPCESFISLLTPVKDATFLEVALIGNEGMLGASMLLDVPMAPLQGQVQGGGSAWRMDTAAFLREITDSRALRQTLHRYLYVSLVQLAQAAVCTRFHVLEARLARWLLMTRDRAHANSFPITHEFMAAMLGVRRVGVTQAATSLQRRELISYGRGNMRVMDGRGLEAAACACYLADKRTYARILH